MIQVECSRVIAASRSEVYALLVDPLLFDKLAGVSGTVISDQELSDGQRVLQSESRLPSNGAAIHTETVFVERVKDERVVFHNQTAPTLAGLASWLRLGRIETERVLTLADDANGTWSETSPAGDTGLSRSISTSPSSSARPCSARRSSRWSA